MLDFEGIISELSHRSMHRVVLENEDDNMTDLVCTMALVTASDWKANIDVNVTTAFDMPPSVKQCSNPSSDVAFCNTTNMRGCISKLSTYIGSCNIYFEPFSVLCINKPSFSI